MGENLSYTGAGLDRAAHLRRDDGWVKGLLSDGETRIVPVWRGRNLIAGDGTLENPLPDAPEAVFLSGEEGRAFLDRAGPVALLGLDAGTAYFACDISSLDDDGWAALAPGGRFEDMRRVGALMAGAEAAVLAYAKGLMHWHLRHLYCGVCGVRTESRDGGHVRVCANAEDTHMHFPRTDPAVIMLVSHDDPEGKGPACLLGRQSRWLEGMYSTLAGFVEPGETLEEAVAREVQEESGVRVADVRYQASQPWPFPSSLMLGFRARAETSEITVDGRELEDASWFTPRDVRGFGEWTEAPAGEKRLPRKDSISRWLIEGWLGDTGGGS